MRRTVIAGLLTLASPTWACIGHSAAERRSDRVHEEYLAREIAEEELAAFPDGGSFGPLPEPPSAEERYSDIICGFDGQKCPRGQCCSGEGYCGRGRSFCKGPQCQMHFSQGLCDADMKPGGESTISVDRLIQSGIHDSVLVGCENPNHIALTFDDGPWRYTPALLDILKQYRIKATFFITAKNFGKGPIVDDRFECKATLKRMYNEGHLLAAHSWSHENFDTLDAETREKQMVYNEMAFRNIFGFFPRFFRPPYGACSHETGCMDQITGMGYQVVNWNLDTLDFRNVLQVRVQRSKDRFMNELALLMAAGKQGPIVLAHDTLPQTVANLTVFMIEELQAQGLTPVDIATCLGHKSHYPRYIDASGTKKGDNSAYDPWKENNQAWPVRVSRTGN